LSQKWGNLSSKLGEVAPDFDSRFWGIEATGFQHRWPQVPLDAFSASTPRPRRISQFYH